MQQKEAFSRLIIENEGIIYKITRLYTNSEEDRNDLYQEIVYQLWKAYDSFRGDSKISTWMYRVALNTALLYTKREKRRGRSVTLDQLSLKYEHYDPLMEERLEAMYQQINSLNDIEKGIILLFLEGKKHEEIAAITGLSKSNIGTRIGRIKDKLRRKIIKQ